MAEKTIEKITIIPWEQGRPGVNYTYSDGTHTMHPIGPADWPHIEGAERVGNLNFINPLARKHFETARNARSRSRH